MELFQHISMILPMSYKRMYRTKRDRCNKDNERVDISVGIVYTLT